MPPDPTAASGSVVTIIKLWQRENQIVGGTEETHLVGVGEVEALRHELGAIPEDLVRDADLVDREVRLEHAARGAKAADDVRVHIKREVGEGSRPDRLRAGL